MRGKVAVLALFVVILRITPAYAGKSSRLEETPADAEDHPRLCGEKMNSFHSRRPGAGSPPPMRGKGPEPKVHTLDIGITPAYAGKSDSGNPHTGRQEDHPRLCGEKVHNGH